MLFGLTVLPNHNENDHKRAKTISSIHYGYRKCGAHALVFSQTLAHGNNKNEIKQ